MREARLFFFIVPPGQVPYLVPFLRPGLVTPKFSPSLFLKLVPSSATLRMGYLAFYV